MHTTPSGKIYIGITSQENLNVRWRNGKGYKHNKHFTNAINKYGWDNIKHDILEENLDEKTAKELEVYYIALYKANDRNYGYNISKGGDGVTGIHRFGKDNYFYGRKHTEETKKLMKENHRDTHGENNTFYGKSHTDEVRIIISQKAKERFANPDNRISRPLTEEQKIQIAKFKSKPILQFDLDMNFICEYENLISLEKLGYRKASIREACVGKRENYRGFIWKYKNETDNEGQVTGIYCLDKDFNLIGCYKSYSEAHRNTSVPRRTISKYCNNDDHYNLGYYWLLAEDYEKFIDGTLLLERSS